MPEIDILNPNQFGDDMNPDYGFIRKRSVNPQTLKARSGAPYFRDMTDTGHSFSLTWTDREFSVVQTLKRYYEQYKDGFFTIIDWDGNGRHYVGRFTTDIQPTPTAFNHWSVQLVTFEELPGCPMVQYPSDWENDAIWLCALDDFLNPRIATSGNWTNASSIQMVNSLGTVLAVNPTGPGPEGIEVECSDHNDLSFAALQYLGYGFKLWSRMAPNMGQVDLYLDGVYITTIDLYAAANTPAAVVFTEASLRLGFHVVKLVAKSTKNAASSGYLVCFNALQVMR